MVKARRASTPGDFIFGGVLIALLAAIVGGVVWAGDSGDTPAILVLAIGGVFSQVLLLIGVIGKGVQVGLRAERSR